MFDPDSEFDSIDGVRGMRPFESTMIRGELRIDHDRLAMAQVGGASMEPMLRPKDTVLVDLKDRDVKTEGVHMVRLDGALLVKKLQRLPGKVLRVSSYNPSYEPFDVSGKDDADRDFSVIGRVRWAGVSFN